MNYTFTSILAAPSLSNYDCIWAHAKSLFTTGCKLLFFVFIKDSCMQSHV
jgi:hypothetical protein